MLTGVERENMSGVFAFVAGIGCNENVSTMFDCSIILGMKKVKVVG